MCSGAHLSLIRIDEVLHCRNIDISSFKHENFVRGKIFGNSPMAHYSVKIFEAQVSDSYKEV
jgi:hypothetical protein